MLQDSNFKEHSKSGTTAQTGNIFQAIVTGSDTGTYSVKVAPLGQRNKATIQGIPIASVMAHMIGFKECALPQVGSTVLCYSSGVNQCLILGTIPAIDETRELAASAPRTVIGAGDGRVDDHNIQGYNKEISKAHITSNARPSDISDADYAIGNNFGVLLGLFQQFGVLKGSDLSQVQTHVLDDLVRIVSHNFQHFHCLGEHKIYHDGQGLHLEIGLTDNPKESLGIPESLVENPTRTIVHTKETEKDDSKDSYAIDPDERVQAIERLKIFIGKLGDFVNILLVRPPESDEAIRSLNGKDIKEFDKGLFQLKLHKDGELMVKSAKAMTFEKTNWIRVPHRILSPEDPTGDDGSTVEYPEKDKFEFDKTYTYEANPFLYFLQIKDYLAYINEEYGYTNFKAHGNDFIVNDDYTAEQALDSISKVDPLSNTEYIKKTSGISLMPNGGITIHDAWGSAIIMEGGNIYIQPAKDLVLQPMRNIIGKVGQNISIAVKKDIDLSSTEGGLRIKTDKTQYFYSDNSGIVLHSEGEATQDFFPEDDDQATEIVSGIVFKAPKTSISSYSKFLLNRVITRQVNRAGMSFFSTDLGMSIIAKESIDIHAKKNLSINATDGNVAILGGAQALFTGISQTVIGLEDQPPFAIAKFGLGKIPVYGFLSVDNLQSFKDYDSTVQGYDTQTFVVNFKEDQKFNDLKFKFLNSDRYGIVVEQDAIPQTLTQMEDELFQIHDLEIWEEVPVNNTLPYPGIDNELFFVTAEIQNLVKEEDGTIHNKGTGNVSTGALNEPQDIFKTYKAK